MPECAIGLHPDVGASWFLNHRSPLLRDSSIGEVTRTVANPEIRVHGARTSSVDDAKLQPLRAWVANVEGLTSLYCALVPVFF